MEDQTTMIRSFLTTLASCCVVYGTVSAEDLTCLKESEQPSILLYAHLQQEAYAALDRRVDAYEQLKTQEQIREYQQKLRDFFIRQLDKKTKTKRR